MSESGKKVEVRYGAFACTIEGYDNPVEQMRDILGLMQQMISETPQLAEQAGNFDPSDVEDALGGGKDSAPGVVVIRNADADTAPEPADAVDADAASATEAAFADLDDAVVDTPEVEAADILTVGRPSDAMDTIDSVPSEVAESDIELPIDDAEETVLPIDDQEVADSFVSAASSDEEAPVSMTDDTTRTDASLSDATAEAEPAETDQSIADQPDISDEINTDDVSPSQFELPAEADAAEEIADLGEIPAFSDAFDAATSGDDVEASLATIEDDAAPVVDADPDVFEPTEDDPAPTEDDRAPTDMEDRNGTGSWSDRIAGFVTSDDTPGRPDAVDVSTPTPFGGAGRAALTAGIAKQMADINSAASESAERSDPIVDVSDENVSEAETGTDQPDTADPLGSQFDNPLRTDEADQPDKQAVVPETAIPEEASDVEVATRSDDVQDAATTSEATTEAIEDSTSEILNIFAAPTALMGGAAQSAPVNIFAAAATDPSPSRQSDTQRSTAGSGSAAVVNIFGAPPEDPDYATDETAAQEDIAATSDEMTDTAVEAEPATTTMPAESIAARDEVSPDTEQDAAPSIFARAAESLSTRRYEPVHSDDGDSPTPANDRAEPEPVPEILGNAPVDILAGTPDMGSASESGDTQAGAPRTVERDQIPEIFGNMPDDIANPRTAAQAGSDASDASDADDGLGQSTSRHPVTTDAEIIEDIPHTPVSTEISGDFEILPPESDIQGAPDVVEPATEDAGVNIFGAPQSQPTTPVARGFDDGFSSDEPPSEPTLLDAGLLSEGEQDGERPPWERAAGPMTDYSASARARAGLDPIQVKDPAPSAPASTGPAAEHLPTPSDEPPTESQSRFKALLQRVHSNSDDAEASAEGGYTGLQAASAAAARADLSASDFAERAECETTADLLAASAAWLTLVNNTPRFTRREVMKVFDTIPGEHPKTLEARIKGYGKLVRNGSLMLIDDGVFTMAQPVVAQFEDLISQG